MKTMLIIIIILILSMISVAMGECNPMYNDQERIEELKQEYNVENLEDFIPNLEDKIIFYNERLTNLDYSLALGNITQGEYDIGQIGFTQSIEHYENKLKEVDNLLNCNELKSSESTPEDVKSSESTPEDVKSSESTSEDVKLSESTPEDVKSSESTPEDVKLSESTSEDIKTSTETENTPGLPFIAILMSFIIAVLCRKK